MRVRCVRLFEADERSQTLHFRSACGAGEGLRVLAASLQQMGAAHRIAGRRVSRPAEQVWLADTADGTAIAKDDNHPIDAYAERTKRFLDGRFFSRGEYMASREVASGHTGTVANVSGEFRLANRALQQSIANDQNAIGVVSFENLGQDRDRYPGVYAGRTSLHHVGEDTGHEGLRRERSL